MSQMDFIQKYKNNIINIGVIIIFAIVAFNIYKNQSMEIVSVNENKESEEKKNTVLEEISRLERKMDDIKKFINNKDVLLTINTLSDIAKEASVRIASFKPLPEQDFPNYKRYPFELTLESGSFHNLGKFINSLESNNNIYIVDNADIKSSFGTGEDNKGKIKMNLKISTILYKEK